jgi:glycosyltransferase involved in cell wall biosynthesis
MNTPAVSIVMACRNAERFLASSVESILNQTCADFEFILIDDASDDPSGELLAEYARHDARIVLSRNESNLGLTQSLNLGLERARGIYIARMDADDIAMPTRIERQRQYLDAHPKVFLVGTAYEYIDEAGNTLGPHTPPTAPPRVAKTLPRTNCIAHPSILFRNGTGLRYRSKFLYAQDYDLYLRLLSEGKTLANLEEPLLRYRQHAESVTLSQAAKQALFADKARAFHRQRISEGQDSYGTWDPRSITDRDLTRSDDPVVLRAEIKASLSLKRYTEARALIRRHAALHGLRDSYILYWPWSLFKQYLARY